MVMCKIVTHSDRCKIERMENNVGSCQLLYLLVLISASFLGHIKLWFNSLKYHSAEVVLHPQKSHSNKCRSNERHTGASEETIFRKFQSRFPTTTRILLHLSIFAKIFFPLEWKLKILYGKSFCLRRWIEGWH